jgi:hypothetical protein
MDDVYERKWDFVFYGKFTVKLISDIERLPWRYAEDEDLSRRGA